MASREGEYLVDLECGDTTSEEEGSGDFVSDYSRGRNALSRGHSGALSSNGLISSVIDANPGDASGKLNEVGGQGQGTDLHTDRSLKGEEGRDLAALLEKRNSNEQRKKVGLKNASKPPRPPKGPLLTASDLKLVKELSELAARKRARIERIKAVRRMKDTKRPSSGSSVTALVITVVFFFIIVFQGIFSGSSLTRNFQGSPAPATANEGLISIQLFNNAPSYEMNQPITLPPNPLEVASGSGPQEQDGRDAG